VIAARLIGRPARWPAAFALMVAATAPFLAYSAERMRHTGDFNLVSYGGYVMSGMAGFILSPSIVERLPPADRELAAQILTRRERLEAEGSVIRTPLNSFRERSFLSAAAGYFDIYARSFDPLVHVGIRSLKAPDETWVAFDRRLRHFAIETIKLAPDRYAAWVVGATSRLVGRMLVTNGPFLLASIGLLAMLLATLRHPARFANLRGSPDTLLLAAIVAIYVLAAALLIVLITFPSSRYIDAAAILLPALPLYAAIRLGQALRTSSTPPPGKT
jgi:hypothetical protein